MEKIKNFIMYTMLTMIGLIVFFVVISVNTDPSTPGTKKEIQYNKIAARRINNFVLKGVLLNPMPAEYYINPYSWYTLDFQKRATILEHCAHHYVSTGGDIMRSVILDSKSGKKLAEYAGGLIKIY